eukprot:1157065-Pelagomonas_calceolata.AAC.17
MQHECDVLWASGHSEAGVPAFAVPTNLAESINPSSESYQGLDVKILVNTTKRAVSMSGASRSEQMCRTAATTVSML